MPAASLLFERELATFPEEDPKEIEKKYLQFAGVGVQFAVTILVLTLLGIWLDGRFDTSPLFTVGLLLFGFVGATWSLVNGVLGPGKSRKQGESGDKK